jgi:hypothetical protein
VGTGVGADTIDPADPDDPNVDAFQLS